MLIAIDTKSNNSKVLISIQGRKSVLKQNWADVSVLRARFPGCTISVNGDVSHYGLTS